MFQKVFDKADKRIPSNKALCSRIIMDIKDNDDPFKEKFEVGHENFKGMFNPCYVAICITS